MSRSWFGEPVARWMEKVQELEGRAIGQMDDNTRSDKHQSFLDQRPVLVVGAGNIGRRVALVWASNARPVTIYDISADALKSATEYITDNLAAYCTRRGTHPGHVSTTSDLRTATSTSGHPERNSAGDITAAEHTKAPWLAIECLPESLPLKTSVLALLERSLPSDCILASNSSSLTTQEMALMSSGETQGAIFPFLAAQMRRVGFTPVVVPRDIQSHGFVFNRIWAACKRETLMVLSEGVAKPADVDALFRDFFHSEKGPCERMDEVGLDTVARVERHNLERKPELGSEAALEWLKRNYIDVGKLGEKSGDGLFTTDERDALKERHHMDLYKEVEETTEFSPVTARGHSINIMAASFPKPKFITGGCLCNKLRYRVNFPENHNFEASSGTCQCTQCRKQTGSLFFSCHTIAPASTQFNFTGDTATLKLYHASPKGERAFCSVDPLYLIGEGADGEEVPKEGFGFALANGGGEHVWCANEIKGVTEGLEILGNGRGTREMES
ncbi:hypothetical protein N0V88_002818 [Collariella sp. IMI 366227]|nr:hypothetical protein N0V88_002818 [Collariella sp. IMI 366227]